MESSKGKNYEGIFLQETNYIAGKTLVKFKHLEDKDANNTATETKIMDGFGVGTLIPTFAKNVFRDDLTI